MGNMAMSIGGYREGDRIGIGQVTAPNHIQRGQFAKRVMVDLNGNGRVDLQDKAVFVTVAKGQEPKNVPLWDGAPAEAAKGAAVKRAGAITAYAGLSGALIVPIAGGLAQGISDAAAKATLKGGAILAGAAVVIGASMAAAGALMQSHAATSESMAVQKHLAAQIPDLIPAR